MIPQQLIELAQEARPTNYAAGMIEHFHGDIMNALNYDQVAMPRGGPLSMESFTASVKLEVSTNERLAEAMLANPGSFIKSIMLAAQTKLLVGQAYHLFYVIPRYNKRQGRLEVTPLISYKGLCDLAQRHPRVHKVDAVLVYEGETFDYDAGAGKLTHKVNMLGDRSPEKVIGGYARVVITEPASTHPVLDDPVIHVMNRAEIDAVMKRSDAWKNAEQKGWRNSPWHTDWKPMARKTLLRAVMNGGSVPKDMGVGAAIAADDEAQLPTEDKPTLPRVSRTQSLRQDLQLDDPPAPPFEFAEEAVAAIETAVTIEEMEALRPRFQHFNGGDADQVAEAWARREDVLGGDA